MAETGKTLAWMEKEIGARGALYLVLLVAVELHATIGMYRLAIKWLTFKGTATRKRLKRVKNTLTAMFLIIGFITFATYMKIGWEHRDRAGERYVPTAGPASAQHEGGEDR